MATFNELKFNIINILRGGISSDDDRLNERQVGFWINYYRSALIYQYYKDGRPLDKQLIQDLGTLKLETVDAANSTKVVFGTSAKRVKIPKLLDLPKSKCLSFIGLADKITPIIIKDAETVMYSNHQRFSGSMRKAYIIENYVYVTDGINEDIKFINVRGLFKDPFAATRISNDCEVPCLTEDDEYPFPEFMIPDLVKSILTSEFNIIKLPNDERNDSVGEKIQNNKQ